MLSYFSAASYFDVAGSPAYARKSPDGTAPYPQGAYPTQPQGAYPTQPQGAYPTQPQGEYPLQPYPTQPQYPASSSQYTTNVTVSGWLNWEGGDLIIIL